MVSKHYVYSLIENEESDLQELLLSYAREKGSIADLTYPAGMDLAKLFLLEKKGGG